MTSLLRYVLISLLLLVAGSGIADAYSQRLYARTGALFVEESPVSTSPPMGDAGTYAAGSIGLTAGYGRYARIRAGFTHQHWLSAEAMLQLYPLGDDGTLDPYAYAGWGRYFSDHAEKSFVPAGIGVEYAITPEIDLTAELEGRWGIARENDIEEVVGGLMPTIGISYRLNALAPETPPASPQPDAPSPETTPEAPSPDRSPSAYSNNPRAPFQDPVAVAPEGRSTTYTRDSLKQTPPMKINRWDPPPYNSPGTHVGSGPVEVSDDGDMVRLPAGVFIMGLTAPDPLDLQTAGRKRISLSPFYIDRFEVTNAEYRNYLDSLAESGELSEQEYESRLPDSTAFRETRARWQTYFYGESNDDRPVVAVTWEEARQYCEWEDKRLPTEAEWEYAARAGRTGGLYPWAGVFAQHNGQYLANFNPEGQGQAADGHAFTAPVGSFPPNRWGMHDMAGNAAEWAVDAYVSSYSQLASLNPAYRDSAESRHVVRGGSYASRSFNIGVGKRSYQNMEEASTEIGFRCAADVSQIEDTEQATDPSFNRPPQQDDDPPSPDEDTDNENGEGTGENSGP